MNLSGIERQGDLMYQFNGMVEKEQAFGLELYETPFRSYDAQLGRFWQTDPLADKLHATSVFQFAFNNPISLNDPTGLIPNNGHLKKEPKYTYSFEQGSWLNSSGGQVGTSEAMGWIHGSYLWDNRDDVLTLSGDIMTKALNLMGEGVVTDLSISEGRGGNEVGRISYTHKASNGRKSFVNISLETNDNDGGRFPVIRPIIDKLIPIIKDGLRLIKPIIMPIVNRTTIAVELEFGVLDKNANGKVIGSNYELAIPKIFTLTFKEDVYTARVRVGLNKGEFKTQGGFKVTGGGFKALGFGFNLFGEENLLTNEINTRYIATLFGANVEFIKSSDGGTSLILGTAVEAGGGGLIPIFGLDRVSFKAKAMTSFRIW